VADYELELYKTRIPNIWSRKQEL